MRGTEFRAALRAAISEKEAQLLREGHGLPISAFNRRTLLELLDGDVPIAEDVSEVRADALRQALEAYLAEYLPAQPDAWKWIILSCLYLGPLCRKPLHPQDAAGYTAQEADGKPVYRCPMRTMEPGSVCIFCVCKSM